MIKIVAFDMMGVLVTNEINSYLIDETKESYPDIKICIATNNASTVKDYINEKFKSSPIDYIFTSEDLNLSKPNPKFFEYILNHYNIKPNEMLFLDDKEINTMFAADLGINTIDVRKDTIVLKEIKEKIENSR